MAAKAGSADVTGKRFERDLARVQDAVRREYVRAGILSEREAETWPRPHKQRYFDDIYKVAASPECARLTIVFEAAEIVEHAVRPRPGPRESAIAALDTMVQAIDQADSVIHSVPVRAHLETVANIGSLVAFQDEPLLDSSALKDPDMAIDWHALRTAATKAKACVEMLERRRSDAFNAGAYVAKGAGPFSHFIYLLHEKGLSVDVITEVIGELPDRASYKTEARWQEASRATRARLEQQILRFRRKVEAASKTDLRDRGRKP